MIKATALVLVLLHGPNGHEILLNPDTVTSMHASRPGVENELMTDEVKCLVNTTDGKFVSVVETCARVRELFKGVNP